MAKNNAALRYHAILNILTLRTFRLPCEDYERGIAGNTFEAT